MKSKAFTLVELLVIISIIGIMSTVIVVGLGTARAKGRDARRVADINLLASKVQDYFNDNHSYPAALNALNYVPKDPQTGSNYNYSLNNNTNPPYFKLTADLEAKGDDYCIGFDIYGANKCP